LGSLGARDVNGLLATQVLEDTGVSAYTGQAPLIKSDAVLASALSIYAVEARHAAWIRSINNASPTPNVFDKPLTKNQVLAAVARTRFIVPRRRRGRPSPGDDRPDHLRGAALYAAAVLALIVTGRRGDARALAGFIPDCVVLVRRLLSDQRVPRRRKLLLVLLLANLAMPFDLVPDFIPVAGQLDDAILVVLVLRALLRSGGDRSLDEHWPGPEQSRVLVQRAAYGR
jgi:uncharacterized membrane protein YkvA (DUF1232 family)